MCHVKVVGLILSRNAFFLFLCLLPLDLSAPISPPQCQTSPLTPQSNTETLLFFPHGSLSPVYSPFYHILPLPSLLFPIFLSFSQPCFFPCKLKEQDDDLHALAYNSLAQLFIPRLSAHSWLFPLVLSLCSFSSLVFYFTPSISLSSLQGCVHFEVTEGKCHRTLLGSSGIYPLWSICKL